MRATILACGTPILALLMVTLAFAQSGTTAATRPMLVLHDDHSKRVCGDPLFPAQATSPATSGSNVIDVCRELIIVDPAVLDALDYASFVTLMSKAAGLANDKERTAFGSTWADSWKTVTSANGDTTDVRSVAANALASAWARDDIRLIAVVNRLDLAMPQQPRETPAEGRLVYQLFRDQSTRGSMNFTIIVEYSLPALTSAGRNADLAAWADRWHALADPRLDRASYSRKLNALVDIIVSRGALARVRTNEFIFDSQSADPVWQFREFTLAGDAPRQLTPGLLPQTPQDRYQDGTDNQALVAYLAGPAIAPTVLDGDHDFNDTGPHFPGLKARVPTNGPSPWLGSGALSDAQKRLLYLMSFNTCNGCHYDMKTWKEMPRPDPLPHLYRPESGAHDPAVLSGFLTGPVPLTHPLPVCLRSSGKPGGCLGGDEKAWHELYNRAVYLRDLVNTPQSPPPTPSTPLVAPAPGSTRYH